VRAGHNEQSTEPQKRERGRPPTYPESVKTEIANRLMQGERLRDICADDNMPSEWMWWYWCTQDPELKEIDDLSKRIRARALYEESEDMIRAAPDDDRDRVYAADVKARHFKSGAALLDPGNFSDKTHAQLGKTGGGAGLAININIGTADGHVETVSLSAGDGEDG
jgi:hypothetical protein